jgi:folate-binding Fe-S cluster repair protein YgfZ
MEHRGTARKRVVGVEGEGPLPPRGTDITAGGASIGTLGSVSGNSGLALLRLDRAEEAKAAGLPLRAGEVTVGLRIPAWARLATKVPAAS